MLREWQRVEDVHLLHFIKLYAKVALEDHMRRRVSQHETKTQHTEKVELFARMQEMVEASSSPSNTGDSFAERTLDWKKFRIPPEGARAIIGSYYMASLRKRIRNQDDLMTSVQQMLVSRKDMIDFLRKFGADPMVAQHD